jgi:hypothetical protein
MIIFFIWNQISLAYSIINVEIKHQRDAKLPDKFGLGLLSPYGQSYETTIPYQKVQIPQMSSEL